MLISKKVIAEKLFTCFQCKESFTISLKDYWKEADNTFCISLTCPWCGANMGWDPHGPQIDSTILIKDYNAEC